MKSVHEYLTEKRITATAVNKRTYEKGTFGYYWTVVRGLEDIEGTEYEGTLDVSGQGLTSLEGCPKVVHGNFDCSHNSISSAEYCPSIIYGSLDMSWNKLLKTLSDGNIVSVLNNITIDNCALENLKGLPNKLTGALDAQSNKIKTFEGCPSEIDGSLDLDKNLLTSLDYAPKIVTGFFSLQSQSVRFSHHDVLEATQVGGEVYV